MTPIDVDCRFARGSFSAHFAASIAFDGITAVFGPNGAGKTALLRVIAGLDREARGRLSFGAETWQDTAAGVFVPAARRGVGLVFQDGRLFSHLSVEGNLAYAERRASPQGPAVDRGAVIEAFMLEGLMKRDTATLSGGEAQRVALARALMARPRLLLMDEPLAALDNPRRADILAFIERVPDLFQVPVLYVTHAIDEVVRLASRLVLVEAGRFVASGPTAEVLSRLDLPPLTGRFEAGVAIDGVVAGIDQDYALTRVDIGGAELTVPRLDFPAGHRVRLRIRARDVSLALKAPEGTSFRNILSATVEEIAPEEDTAFAEVRLKLGSQILRARLTRKSADELDLRPGLEVFALIKGVALDRRLLLPGNPHTGQIA